MEKIHAILLLKEDYLDNYIKYLDKRFENFDSLINFNKKIIFYFKKTEAILENSTYLKNIENSFEIENVNDFFVKLEKYFKENNYNEDKLESTFIFLNYYEDIFLDFNLNKKILLESLKYDIEYYYGEGFPDGIIGQVLRANTISEIIPLIKSNDNFEKNFIFSILLRNISFFDIDLIEGEQEPEIFRYSLKLNKKEDIDLIDNVIKISVFSNINELVKNKDSKTDLDKQKNNSIKKIDTRIISKKVDKNFINENLDKILNIDYKIINVILKNNPELIRTYPKTIFLEISSQYSSDLIYLPSRDMIERSKKYLTLNDITQLYDSNNYFFKDSIIILEGFGEPFANSEIIDIINFLSEKNKVIIKTTGSFFNSDFTKKLNNFKNVTVIILLDASNEETYKIVGHNENFKKVETFTKYFLEKYPDNFFIEFTRMKENDTDIEQFYEKWKKYESNIIFRKYNDYSGILKDREVADLTPVNRFPCFHLRRDFYILSDGKVAICKSDFNGQMLKENVFEKDCYEIFKNYNNLYLDHINKKYPEICKKCNEFYTFNF